MKIKIKKNRPAASGLATERFLAEIRLLAKVLSFFLDETGGVR